MDRKVQILIDKFSRKIERLEDVLGDFAEDTQTHAHLSTSIKNYKEFVEYLELIL